jgi:hypothetical protein
LTRLIRVLVLVLVFGFVLVRMSVNDAVGVLMRMFVTGGMFVLVLMVVIGVPVFVRMFDAVRMMVRMLVLVGHGLGFGPRAAAALSARAGANLRRAVRDVR